MGLIFVDWFTKINLCSLISEIFGAFNLELQYVRYGQNFSLNLSTNQLKWSTECEEISLSDSLMYGFSAMSSGPGVLATFFSSINEQIHSEMIGNMFTQIFQITQKK